MRQELSEGRLKPGSRLPAERELADQFGVSRTAVREAMRSLEVAGLIASERGVNGGTFIQRGDPELITQAVQDMVLVGRISIDSLTETRIMLMNDALRLACERATNVDLDAIERDIDLVEELTLSGNLTRRSTYIINFYDLAARATNKRSNGHANKPRFRDRTAIARPDRTGSAQRCGRGSAADSQTLART
ncbi:FadR/GntR family transcriptional regulator [Cupriavidus basilensis]